MIKPDIEEIIHFFLLHNSYEYLAKSFYNDMEVNNWIIGGRPVDKWKGLAFNKINRHKEEEEKVLYNCLEDISRDIYFYFVGSIKEDEVVDFVVGDILILLLEYCSKRKIKNYNQYKQYIKVEINLNRLNSFKKLKEFINNTI